MLRVRNTTNIQQKHTTEIDLEIIANLRKNRSRAHVRGAVGEKRHALVCNVEFVAQLQQHSGLLLSWQTCEAAAQNKSFCD